MVRETNDILHLVWKDPKTRRNFIVGELIRSDTFKFQYCGEYRDAQEHGWQKLTAFPDERVYESPVLFPVFSSRLPDPKRRDIDSILDKYKLSKYDAFDLLGQNGGRLPIDTYEFIRPIFPEEENIQREFYIMGIRHVALCQGENCELLPNVKINDFLKLVPESENSVDKNAIKVVTNLGDDLGYVPRYYNKEILKRISIGCEYVCKIIEVNRFDNCSECVKVLLKISNKEKACDY